MNERPIASLSRFFSVYPMLTQSFAFYNLLNNKSEKKKRKKEKKKRLQSLAPHPHIKLTLPDLNRLSESLFEF